MTEKELVLKFKQCADAFDEADKAYDEASKALDQVKAELVTMLENDGKDRTASYDGIGFATAIKPKLYAGCLVENQDRLFEFLQKEGRDDLIKATVHHSALASYVGERIEAGQPIPEFISYGFKQNVKLYPPKN